MLALFAMSLMISRVAAQAAVLRYPNDTTEDPFEGAPFDVTETEGSLSDDGLQINVTITVRNDGSDFKGTVRLEGGAQYYYSTIAFDRTISIGAGETESAVITIPSMQHDPGYYIAMDYTVVLIDDKGKTVYEEEIPAILEASRYYIGIISDNPSELSYLDKKDIVISSANAGYDLRTSTSVIASAGDASELSQYSCIMISDYDTSKLSEDAIDNLISWTRAGGMLMIGLSSGGNEIKGFPDDFTDINVNGNALFSDLSYEYGMNDTYNVCSGRVKSNADVRLVSYGSDYSMGLQQGIPVRQDGKGAAAVFPFELSHSVISYETMVISTIEIIDADYILTYGGTAGDQYYTSTLSSYNIDEIIGMMAGKGNFRGGIITALIIIYVIFVGPGLYLILKAVNKRELLWAAIPASALLFTGAMFIASFGFSGDTNKVRTINLYSDDINARQRAVVMGFNSSGNGWSMNADGNVLCAGPAFSSNNYDYEGEPDYIVSRKPDGLTLTYAGSGTFDKVAFECITTNKPSGAISANGIIFDTRTNTIADGTVTNNTGKTLESVCIVCMDTSGYIYTYVYDKALKPGDSVKASQLSAWGNGSGIYYCISDKATKAYRAKDYDKARNVTAMAVGGEMTFTSGAYVYGVAESDDDIVSGSFKQETVDVYYSRVEVN